MLQFIPGVEWIKKRSRQITVTEKALLLFSIPVFFLLAVFFLLVQVQRVNEKEQDYFWQSQEAIGLTETISKHISEADNYLQLTFITGNQDFLPLFSHAVSDLRDSVKQLHASDYENPSEQHLVNRINNQVAQKLSFFTQAKQLIHNHDKTALLNLIHNNSNVGHFIGLRLDLQSLLQSQLAADARRQLSLIQSYQTLSWQLGMIVPVSILFTLLGAIQYNRWISYRIDDLTDKAQQTVKGNKDANLFNTTGNDEISNLARAISQLGRSTGEDDQSALDNVSDVVCLLDTEGNFLKVSRASLRAWGYTHRELAGRNYLEIVVPKYAESTSQWMKRIVAGHTEINFENAVRHQDGSVVYNQWFGYWSPRDQAIFAVAHDISARKLLEQRQATQYALTTILAESENLEDVTKDILKSICEGTGWCMGALWVADSGDTIRCVDIWHDPDTLVSEFVSATRNAVRESGFGLPGRVLQSGHLSWIPDLSRDANFPRASAALKEGLHGAIAFPIVWHGEVLAVMEFFSHEIRLPDDGLLQMFATIGCLLGQFMKGRRTPITLSTPPVIYSPD